MPPRGGLADREGESEEFLPPQGVGVQVTLDLPMLLLGQVKSFSLQAIHPGPITTLQEQTHTHTHTQNRPHTQMTLRERQEKHTNMYSAVRKYTSSQTDHIEKQTHLRVRAEEEDRQDRKTADEVAERQDREETTVVLQEGGPGCQPLGEGGRGGAVSVLPVMA